MKITACVLLCLAAKCQSTMSNNAAGCHAMTAMPWRPTKFSYFMEMDAVSQSFQESGYP